MTTLAVATLPATSAHAEPTLAQVEKQVAVLTDKMQLATEQYNQARLVVAASKAKVAALEPRAKVLRGHLAVYERELSTIATIAYASGRRDVFTAMISSGSPQEFLDQSAFLEQITVKQRADIQGLLVTKKQFDEAKAKVDAELRKQAANEKLLRDRRSQINKDLALAQKLSVKLGGPKRVAPTPYDGSATGKPAVALEYAYAQQGKMYEFGADGPDRFDCSGFTKASYRAAGITLPHSAKSQFARFPKIPKPYPANLRPGDLVMYGSPIRHVAMYVGNGKVIHASTYNEPIRIVPLARGGGTIAGAVRPY